MFLIVSSALPDFFSSHKTLSILVLGGRHSGVEGWCAGRNPPFVQVDGIWLYGLPAPRADRSQASICPFTSQDSRFTVSHSTVLNELIFASSSQVEGTFRFCAVAKALTLHLCRCCES